MGECNSDFARGAAYPHKKAPYYLFRPGTSARPPLEMTMKLSLLGRLLAGSLAVFAMSGALAQSKPAQLKIGVTTFLSGPASVFGVPAKAAAELYIEQLNAAGGINGVKIVPAFIDEGVGADKLLSEYRRVVQESGTRVMIASISSGNCNTLAPVAEDLKVLNIMWDCGTEKVLEDRRYKYVVRTQANATTEMVAAVLYLLRAKPDLKSIAVVNQDYAWAAIRGSCSATRCWR